MGLTQSLATFLFLFHRDIVHLVMFGHVELITNDIWNEYIEWCKTPEGKSYLKGGSNYDPEYAKDIGIEEE